MASGRVLFRVAAGPRQGFGHLVRCRSLARALGVTPLVSIRGGRAAVDSARAHGWTVVDARNTSALAALDAALLVVDDPSPEAAATWVHRARRLSLPVASVHDLGRGHLDSDLVIDGSVATAPGAARSQGPALRGPRFAILDPRVLQVREGGRRPVAGRVLIALGGGGHVYQVAARMSQAIVDRLPGVEIRVARGFAAATHDPALPPGARWIDAHDGLADELGAAEVALVAGGVTLYEACAVGTPIVALAVTEAQHITVRGMACHGAAVDGGRPPLDEAVLAHAADAVAILMTHDKSRACQAMAARQLVDGRGVFRVADRLRRLARARLSEVGHAA